MINMVSFIKMNELFAHYYTLRKATTPPGIYVESQRLLRVPLFPTKLLPGNTIAIHQMR